MPLPCYQPGDRGTVWRGPTTTADIDDYLLTVDRNQDRNAIFTTDEVEPFV